MKRTLQLQHPYEVCLERSWLLQKHSINYSHLSGQAKHSPFAELALRHSPTLLSAPLASASHELRGLHQSPIGPLVPNWRLVASCHHAFW